MFTVYTPFICRGRVGLTVQGRGLLVLTVSIIGIYIAGAMGLSPANTYSYTEKLLALEGSAGDICLHHEVAGFLPLAEWDPFLRSYPDQRMAAFLRRGFRFGFRIGFNQAQPLNSFSENHRSVALQPQVVSEHIADEVAQGKLRPVSPGSVHVSPMGLIPKSSQPGKLRSICPSRQ